MINSLSCLSRWQHPVARADRVVQNDRGREDGNDGAQCVSRRACILICTCTYT
jgi:hypothetical protein